jgi:hypothetical protein
VRAVPEEAGVMIELVRRAMFEQVAMQVILADLDQHQWNVINRECVHEFLNQIFQKILPVKS